MFRRTNGRPPFLLGGLILLLVILSFSYWTLNTQNNDVLQTLEKLQAQLKIGDVKIEQSERKMSALQDLLHEKEESVKQEEAKLIQQEEDLKSFNNDLKKRDYEITSLKNDIEKLNQKIRLVEDKYSECEGDNEKILRENDLIMSQRDDAVTALNKRDDHITDLTRKLDQEREHNRQLDANMNQINKQLAYAHAQLSNAKLEASQSAQRAVLPAHSGGPAPVSAASPRNSGGAGVAVQPETLNVDAGHMQQSPSAVLQQPDLAAMAGGGEHSEMQQIPQPGKSDQLVGAAPPIAASPASSSSPLPQLLNQSLQRGALPQPPIHLLQPGVAKALRSSSLSPALGNILKQQAPPTPLLKKTGNKQRHNIVLGNTGNGAQVVQKRKAMLSPREVIVQQPQRGEKLARNGWDYYVPKQQDLQNHPALHFQDNNRYSNVIPQTGPLQNAYHNNQLFGGLMPAAQLPHLAYNDILQQPSQKDLADNFVVMGEPKNDFQPGGMLQKPRQPPYNEQSNHLMLQPVHHINNNHNNRQQMMLNERRQLPLPEALDLRQFHGRPDYGELQQAVGLLGSVGNHPRGGAIRQRGLRDTGYQQRLGKLPSDVIPPPPNFNDNLDTAIDEGNRLGDDPLMPDQDPAGGLHNEALLRDDRVHENRVHDDTSAKEQHRDEPFGGDDKLPANPDFVDDTGNVVGGGDVIGGGEVVKRHSNVAAGGGLVDDVKEDGGGGDREEEDIIAAGAVLDNTPLRQNKDNDGGEVATGDKDGDLLPPEEDVGGENRAKENFFGEDPPLRLQMNKNNNDDDFLKLARREQPLEGNVLQEANNHY